MISNPPKKVLFHLSTGQKPQCPEEMVKVLGEVKGDVTEEIESMAEERVKGSLKGFFKGMGWWWSCRYSPVR